MIIHNISPNVKRIRKPLFRTFNKFYNEHNIVADILPNGIITIELDLINSLSMKEMQECIDSKYLFPVQHLKNFLELFMTEYAKFEDDGLCEDVSITGIKENINDGQGSRRFSTNSFYLAQHLTNIIKELHIFDDYNGHYEFDGVSQYFRFMKYTKGGSHYPHYDSDYIYGDKDRVTKYSLVMYFNDCKDGEIYFCNDTRPNHKNTDWVRHAKDDEIYLKIKPQAGKIVLFPHDLCHGVAEFTGDMRCMVRGDLTFKFDNKD